MLCLIHLENQYRCQTESKPQTKSSIHGNSQRTKSESGGDLAGKYSQASFVNSPILRPPQPSCALCFACSLLMLKPENPEPATRKAQNTEVRDDLVLPT